MRQFAVRSFGFYVLLCISLLGIVGVSLSVRGQDVTGLGFASQAAFIANFPKFIEWPANMYASPEAPLVICVFGHKEFAASIASMTHDEIIRGRRRVLFAPPLRDLRSCHVLYIGQAETGNRSVLTVGETPDFLESGGAIQFSYDDRLRFEVNLGPIASAGLRIDSRLLALARHVHPVEAK